MSVAALDHVFLAWDEQLLIDVLDERLHEWRADFLDSLFEPNIIVEELSLAGQDAEIDSEIEVAAIDNLDQAVLDLLCDVEYSRKVEHSLIVPTALSDTSNHQVLVDLPQLLQHGNRLLIA